MRLQRIHTIEVTTMLVVISVAILVWGFAVLSDAVMSGRTHAFDERLLLLLRSPNDYADPLGPAWFEEMMRDFTALGSLGVLGLVTLVASGYLVMERHFTTLVILLGSVLGGTLVSTLLKNGFDRIRPDLVPHGMEVFTPSFPSGHAYLATVTYLTLGVLIAQEEGRVRVKRYIVMVSLAISFLVGISRVYLGVHWPTDVFAGWIIGGAWALACWLLADRVLGSQVRGADDTRN